MNIVLLLVLLGMVVAAGRDAWLDKTPMKPWSWARPDLEWWTTRRTRQEKARGAIDVGGAR
jgi:hypothetical protein